MFVLDLDCSPVTTSNLLTPWYLSLESSAGLYPLPFFVTVWIKIGPSYFEFLTLFKTGIKLFKLCPSIGPT